MLKEQPLVIKWSLKCFLFLFFLLFFFLSVTRNFIKKQRRNNKNNKTKEGYNNTKIQPCPQKPTLATSVVELKHQDLNPIELSLIQKIICDAKRHNNDFMVCWLCRKALEHHSTTSAHNHLSENLLVMRNVTTLVL